MRLSQLLFFFFCFFFSTSVFPGDGMLKQQLGGWVTDMVSSHGQTYIGQGSTLVTLSWNSERIPSVSKISEPLDGWIKHLHVDGDTLWVAAASELDRGHIYEFSLSENDAPRFVAEWRLSDGGLPKWGVLESVGNLLYVGGYNGIVTGYRQGESSLQQVFEIELASEDVNEATWLFHGFESWENGFLLAVVQQGHRYTDAHAHTAMHMLDVSDPAMPYVVSQATSTGSLGYARYERKIAALGSGAFNFYDWSDPHDPQREMHRSIYPSILDDALFREGHVISFRGRVVRVHRLSSEQPLESVSRLLISEASGQWILDYSESPDSDLVMFATRNAEIAVVDFGDVESPKVHYLLDLPPGTEILSVADAGDSVLAISDYGLFGLSRDLRLRWSSPEPSLTTRFTDLVAGDGWLVAGRWIGKGLVMTFNSIDDVQVEGEVDYDVTRLWRDGADVWSLGNEHYPGLDLYDFTDPSSPEHILGYEIPNDDVTAIRKSGDVLYLANGFDGIGIARIDNEGGVGHVGYVSGCYAVDLDVRGDLLVAGCAESGVRFYDISSPEAPELISTLESSSSPKSLLIDGELLWYATYRKVGLYDISEPERPLNISNSPQWSIVSSTPVFGNTRVWPERTARLGLSDDGGVWVSTGVEGIAELSGVSAMSASFTGPWHDPMQPGQGFVLEVLGDDLASVTWFEYDARGDQEWFQGVGSIEGHRIEIDEVYRTQGGAFADPETSIDTEVIGSARLAFHDCDTGVVEMEFEAETRISWVEPVTRTMRIGCRLPDDAVVGPQADQTGLWHDPSLPGQGVYLTWIATGSAVLNWFTYDSNGNHLWIQGIGSQVDGQLVFDDLYSTAASRHGIEYDPDLLRTLPWGEAALDLECWEGTLRWNSSRNKFGSGSMQLERLTIPSGFECDG